VAYLTFWVNTHARVKKLVALAFQAASGFQTKDRQPLRAIGDIGVGVRD
jgi:hypothetical protein